MAKVRTRAIPTLALLILLGFPALRLRAEEGAPVPGPKRVPPTTPPRPPPAVAPETRANLEATVRTLAAPERNGRRAWEDRKAVAAWIASRFAELGLAAPPGRDGMTFDQGGTPETPEARHVLGWIAGKSAEPKGSGEWVLVASHYDGIGEERGQACPGANDNASDVAVLLEAARAMVEAARTAPPARSVLFVAVDQKVSDNLGPRLLAEGSPLPLDRCIALLNVEMVGRSLMDMMPGRLFVLGGERSAALDELCSSLGAPEGGTLSRAESDFHLEPSVYVPFRERQLPFLYVTSGLSQDRFRASDSAENLDYPHLAARSAWFARLLARVTALPQRPAWRPLPPPRIEEVALVKEILMGAIAGIRERGASPAFERMAAGTLKPLDATLAKGSVTREERDKLRAAAIGLVRFLFDLHR